MGVGRVLGRNMRIMREIGVLSIILLFGFCLFFFCGAQRLRDWGEGVTLVVVVAGGNPLLTVAADDCAFILSRLSSMSLMRPVDLVDWDHI